MTDYAGFIGPDMLCADVLFVPQTDSNRVVLMRRDEPEGRVFLHSDWAQSQVYSHYGVRPKWFDFVVIEQRAVELNLRLAATPNHRFRPLLLDDATGMVRGFVSPQYAEIADVDVMTAVTGAFADPSKVRVAPTSLKTDQCLYAHVFRDEASSVPAGKGAVYLGLTVMNSEVGYTALKVLPIMFLSWSGTYVPVPQGKLFRRIHRGEIDLVNDLGNVLRENSAYVGEFAELVTGLEATDYQAEHIALGTMLHLVVNIGRGTKTFAEECRKTYVAAAHKHHTGMTIVEAIAQTAAATLNADTRYVLASLAGIAAAHITKA